MRDSAPVAAAREVRTLADVMTLVTLDDSDVRMVALVDVTVVQGEPRSIELQLPANYEVTGISGSSLAASDQRDGGILLTVAEPAARHHQFLVSLERPHQGGSFALDTGFVSVPDVQRERGEIAIEGVGTLELTATGRGAGASQTRRQPEACTAPTSASSMPRCSRWRGCRSCRRSAISAPPWRRSRSPWTSGASPMRVCWRRSPTARSRPRS